MNSFRSRISAVLLVAAVFVGFSASNANAAAPAPVKASSSVNFALDATGGLTGGDTSASGCSRTEDASSASLLPAWRWDNMEIDSDGSGVSGMVRQIPTAIAWFTLSAAQLMWKILLTLTRFAIDSNSIVCGAAPVINNGAAAVGHRIFFFALFFVAFVIWRVVKSLLKGNPIQALRTGGTFVLLFALVVVITSSSEKAATLPPDQQSTAAGTLPGFTTFVASASGKLTGELFTASSLLRVPGTVKDAKSTQPVSAQGNTPTCEAYITKLHQDYLATSNSPTLVAVSGLWEKTQYKSWQTVTFGSPVKGVDIPGRVMCHWAEAVSSISPTDQQQYASTVPGYQGIKAASAGRVLAFGPYSIDDRRRAMTAWAACEWNGKSWQTRPEWKGVWGSDDAYGASRCGWLLNPGGKFGDKAVTAGSVLGSVCGLAGGVAGAACTAVGDKITIIGGDDPFNLFGTSFSSAFENDTQTPEMRDKIAAAKSYANAFNGYNAADRLVEGFLALIVAFFFLLALGSIAVGAFVAQFMLIVLLIFSPITITMYALGSKKGSALAKLTGTTMVSQAFFTLLITSIVAIADVFQSMVEGIVTFGLMRTIMVGLSPLAAFYCVRKLLMSFGMADLLKPTGALSFMASASLVATGDKAMSDFGRVDDSGRNGIQRTGSKVAAGGIKTAFAAANAAATGLETGNRWMNPNGETRSGLKTAHKANKAEAKKQKLSARLDEIARGVEGRLENDETDRVNRGLNFLADRTVESGGTGRLGRALLLASNMTDSALASASSEVTDALGVGDPARRALTDASYIDMDGVSKPDFVDPARIAQSNRLLEARRQRALAAAGDDPQAITSINDDFNSQIALSSARQYLGDGYDGRVLAPQEQVAYSQHLDSTFGGKHLVTSTGQVIPKDLGMTRSEMQNSESFTPEMMRLPESWLPVAITTRQKGETDDQYAGRIHTTLQSKGLMDASGNRVDMLEKMNISIDEVIDWKSGMKNDKLDKKSVYIHNSGDVIRRSQAFNEYLGRRALESSRDQRTVAAHMVLEIEDIRKELPTLVTVSAKQWTDVAATLAPLQSVTARLEEARVSGNVTESLEAERRQARSDFDNAKKKWQATQAELAGSVIATRQMIASLSGEIATGGEFAERLVGENKRLQETLAPLEQLAERVFVGQRDAMDEYRKIGSELVSQAAVAANSTAAAIQAATISLKLNQEQAKATARTKKAAVYTTTRDIVNTAMNSVGSDNGKAEF